MAKPAPELLAPDRYPFECEIGTRFGDLDLNHHLNNVALAGLIEEGRVRFNTAHRLPQVLGGHGAMIASTAIDYLGQAFYPQPVRGLAAVETIGRSSWTTVQVLLQEDRPVVFARAILVCVKDGASTRLPANLRDALEGMALR